jgi:hypothetical protein
VGFAILGTFAAGCVDKADEDISSACVVEA